MKQIIRLTEGQFHKVVEDTVRKIVEGYYRGVGQFYVKKMLSTPVDVSSATKTQHWNERNGRMSTINSRAGEIGDAAYSFIVDTGHKNGAEIHTITEKAFIVIQNEETGRLVTILAARPGQIVRYWNYLGMDKPADGTFSLIMRFAKNDEGRGLNNS